MRVRLPLLPALVAALFAAGTVPASAAETVVALTPAEKEKLLDDAAARAQSRPADGELPVNGLAGKVHGEVGMFVGTGGARGVYGAAAAPIGENGSVAVRFENSRFRDLHRVR